MADGGGGGGSGYSASQSTSESNTMGQQLNTSGFSIGGGLRIPSWLWPVAIVSAVVAVLGGIWLWTKKK
jgi:hypothetical protein